jgi:hypothetical protein
MLPLRRFLAPIEQRVGFDRGKGRNFRVVFERKLFPPAGTILICSAISSCVWQAIYMAKMLPQTCIDIAGLAAIILANPSLCPSSIHGAVS